MRLCYAARLFDEGELTIADVAYRLEYASPQSFGRHLRIVLGITPSEFRARFPFCAVLDRFLDRFVHPYRETWREFKPLAPGRG
jgi:AraC-like DNA-binding protein